jgi:hypothetical protein
MKVEKRRHGPATATSRSIGRTANPGCGHCGAAEPHVACPVCEGRGCLSTRELAEKLGLREALDATEITAAAVAKAVDARVLASIEATKKMERERTEQLLAADRRRYAESEERLRRLVKDQGDEISKLSQSRADAEARAKLAEEQLKHRRQQPAAIGRTAERDFASFISSHPDLRVSQKLVKSGDFEVWVKVDLGDGTLAEIPDPILVDVKRESAALQATGLVKLVRDCRARGRLVGALVADRVEEVGEIFGPSRVRMVEGIVVLLTSIDAFCQDVRLLAVLQGVARCQALRRRTLAGIARGIPVGSRPTGQSSRVPGRMRCGGAGEAGRDLAHDHGCQDLRAG